LFFGYFVNEKKVIKKRLFLIFVDILE